MTLEELCNMLSISEATGKNWLRLGKISPDILSSPEPSFSKEYADSLIEDISSGKVKALISRRNKKYISGSFFYDSYVPKDSDCLPKVREITQYLKDNNISLSKKEVCLVLSHYARQLFGNDKSIPSTDLLIEDLKNSYKDTDSSSAVSDSPSLDTNISSEDTESSSVVADNPSLDSDISSKDANRDHLLYLKSKQFIYEQGADTLGLLYMSLRDLGSRKNAGSYYTPTDIVIKSIENLKYNNPSSKSIADKKDSCNIQVLDPCCGSGNFLIQMPDLINPCNIYGCDIDPVCVCLARVNLALKYGLKYACDFKKNIRCANFLKSELSDIFAQKDMKPDIIIGNPPWGFDFSREDKDLYKSLYQTAKGKSTESYDIFTEKAISCLKENGRLSFVLPEASLTVKLHKALREIIISSCNITYLAYLGNVFHKVACPCVILQLVKTGRMLETKGLIVDDLTMSSDKGTPNKPLVIGTNRKVSSDKLSFYTDDEEYAILEAMSSLKPCTYLKDNATFALGIVTGDNDRYIKETPSGQAEIILKGSDISRYYISKPGRYIVYKPESFQQVAPKSIYRADEKLFYRFISNDLIFAYDNEGLLSLNSCNILIPRIPGLSIKYIMAILNSSCAGFYYKKSFNSVKVLRSHLEQIPIPLVTKDEQDRIVSLADRIIQKAPSIYKDTDKGSPNNIEVSPLYEELDAMISSVYGLTPSQHKRINAKM